MGLRDERQLGCGILPSERPCSLALPCGPARRPVLTMTEGHGAAPCHTVRPVSLVPRGSHAAGTPWGWGQVPRVSHAAGVVSFPPVPQAGSLQTGYFQGHLLRSHLLSLSFGESLSVIASSACVFCSSVSRLPFHTDTSTYVRRCVSVGGISLLVTRDSSALQTWLPSSCCATPDVCPGATVVSQGPGTGSALPLPTAVGTTAKAFACGRVWGDGRIRSPPPRCLPSGLSPSPPWPELCVVSPRGDIVVLVSTG